MEHSDKIKKKTSKIKNKPKAGSGDVAHAILKAAISGIPGIGGPGAELFSAIIIPPLTKRRDEWIESIANGLIELEKEVEDLKIENLAEDEMFITTVMHASRTAIQNHQKEKLEALRNAVLNTATSNSPEEDIQIIFLNLIDIFTPWHLRILKFFDDPIKWGEENNIAYPDWTIGGPSTVLEHAITELRGDREFYDFIVKDLRDHGLMNIASLHVTMTPHGMFASRTTNLGKSFLNFIASPYR